MDELIRKKDAIDAVCTDCCGGNRDHDCRFYPDCDNLKSIKAIPPVQPDEKLEKCRFEYINACQIVTYPTPDTTKKDISDAYAVIKVLQPIFGDVTF